MTNNHQKSKKKFNNFSQKFVYNKIGEAITRELTLTNALLTLKGILHSFRCHKSAFKQIAELTKC